MESPHSPHGLHGDSWRVPMESSWSLWERVGECKVLESSDGVTQSFDAIKFDIGYRIPINHGDDQTRSSAMVHN